MTSKSVSSRQSVLPSMPFPPVSNTFIANTPSYCNRTVLHPSAADSGYLFPIIYSFPDLFMATIYDYVRRNRKYFKDKLSDCKTDWYFKPSSCLKQYEEIQNLYIATGTNDMVMDGIYEICNMMQKRKVVKSLE